MTCLGADERSACIAGLGDYPVAPVVIGRNAWYKLSEGAQRDEQWGHPTVAVDLDMTLTAEPWTRYDYIADPQPEAHRVLARFVAAGWRVIIHTCRPDVNIIKAWSDRHFPGLITGINHNPDPAATGWATTPKPFASIYIDDKAWPLRGEPIDWLHVEADMEDRGVFTCGTPGEDPQSRAGG